MSCPLWVWATSQSQMQSSWPPVVLPHIRWFSSFHFEILFSTWIWRIWFFWNSSTVLMAKLSPSSPTFLQLPISTKKSCFSSDNLDVYWLLYLPINCMTNLRRTGIVREFISVNMFFAKSSMDTWLTERWMKFESILYCSSNINSKHQWIQCTNSRNYLSTTSWEKLGWVCIRLAICWKISWQRGVWERN